jgi:flavine halogenase
MNTNGEPAAAEPTGHEARYASMASLYEQAEQLETPWDFILRIVDYGRQAALLRIGSELGVFVALDQSADPLSTSALQANARTSLKGIDVEERLLSRILRFFAASRYITEEGPSLWAANRRTKMLADPRMAGAIKFMHIVSNPAYQHWPDYLSDVGYRDASATNTPSHIRTALQRGLDTDLPSIFSWLGQHPDILKDFHGFIDLAPHKDPITPNAIDAIPFGDFLKSSGTSSDDDRPVFLDVGGGAGQQCARLLAKHPELAGRVILQDQPSVLETANAIPGVKFMPHDFFTRQPITGIQPLLQCSLNSLGEQVANLPCCKVQGTTISAGSCMTGRMRRPWPSSRTSAMPSPHPTRAS